MADFPPVRLGSGATDDPAQSHDQIPPPNAVCPYRRDISVPIRRDTAHQAESKILQSPADPMQHVRVTPLPDTNHAGGTPTSSAPHSGDRVQPQTRPGATRPTPRAQIEDPREFQISQINRRFSPEVTDDGETTSMTFRLKPSDPDFPFELTGLRCTLTIPKHFPGTGKPRLRVHNPEMERGYQINVERGFETLVDQFPQKSLLGLMNELDKTLEKFLTLEKAPTVTILAHPPGAGGAGGTPTRLVAPDHAVKPAPTAETIHWPPHQRAEAAAKRASDVRQLEARMGRHPLFAKSANGTSFTLPLQVPQPERVPLPLRSLQDITLLVPLWYPLEPCTVFLNGVDSLEAGRVEAAFARQARQQPERSLMAHVNHLAQNMHRMVHEHQETRREGRGDADGPDVATLSAPDAAASDRPKAATVDDEKPHVQVIPRPPEWATPNEHSDADDSSDTSGSEDELSDDADGGAAVPADSGPRGPDTGVLLSFPSLELYGIELLKVAAASVAVKCERCRTVADVKNLQPQHGTSQPAKTEACHKCANLMSVRYRGEPMHAHSVHAGYLDLEGCAVVDLLPSSFIPTCSDCSTDYSTPGVVSVRGDTTLAMCRTCHHKMSFKIPDVKFLRVSSAGVDRPDRPLARKKAKEQLGLVAGQALPQRGRCQHYGKSYRWFRFSCCAKVYPCDRCHDAAEEHPNEHANRMICGFCSREQAYRPEDCGLCHGVLVGKRGGGFWEGGKGTRDKVRMSRKDPRKYKRRAGGAVVGGTGKPKAK